MSGYRPADAALIAADIEGWLARHSSKHLLRFITCGSVDDGKSTLIGRLLADTRSIPEDQLEALLADSARIGTQGTRLDYALLVDGLTAEREQGITIDVAYRFFATEAAKFIVADTPGHEQYTRNMATAASTAEAAVVLIDARKGVLRQTRRHSYICRLLGVPNIVLAVNKMDLVDYDEATFRKILGDYLLFAHEIGLGHVTAIPMSGLEGDNIVERSSAMRWHDGPTLLEKLEALAAVASAAETGGPFRMPVQWVNRPNLDFRGFAGTVAQGRVRPGDQVRVLPSGRTSRVERIVSFNGDLAEAEAGQAVTLTLADEVDISRGDVIAIAGDPPQCADQFEATLVWMSDEPLLPGRTYVARIGAAQVNATVQTIRHAVDVNTLAETAARTLELNEIGVVHIGFDRDVAFEPYDANRELGGFILIDRATNATLGAGMIRFALRRASNIHWQAIDITREAHATQKGQRPAVLWFTGLSGSGKSTIANLVEKKLHALGRHSFLLDGDNVRHGLNRDLGFTDADRVENIRRVGEVARLMADAGLIVLTAFISPFRAERDMVRALLPQGEFVEVFVDTPLAEAERRDVKGLYAKARAGRLSNFTGIDSPYEAPEAPEIRVDTMTESAEAAAERIVAWLLARG